jgi:hypothetical protein
LTISKDTALTQINAEKACAAEEKDGIGPGGRTRLSA